MLGHKTQQQRHWQMRNEGYHQVLPTASRAARHATWQGLMHQESAVGKHHLEYPEVVQVNQWEIGVLIRELQCCCHVWC